MKVERNYVVIEGHYIKGKLQYIKLASCNLDR